MDSKKSPIAVTTIPDGFRVAVFGPIHLNLETIQPEFDRLVAAKPKRVELDLSQSEHVSSIGFSALINLRNRLKADGGTLAIVKILPRTRQIFTAAYLEKLFAFAPNAVIDGE